MMRIAMWSGPRNLSTALMYAFASRGDCAVRDEPFYAAYLAATGVDHPMRDDILAAGQTDPGEVARACIAPAPDGVPHVYLKLMAHHMISGFPRGWAERCANVHLIRHPARVIASYGAKRAEMSLEDLGFPQQLDLYESLGGAVIDSADIRADPARALATLCGELGLPYRPEMLHWPKGGHPDDGVWAPHWYGAVHRSTGFAGPEGPLPVLDGEAARLCDAAMPVYEALKAAALRP